MATLVGEVVMCATIEALLIIRMIKIACDCDVRVKGACATWYNLLLSGEGDYDTRHAACPVLSGSKWG